MLFSCWRLYRAYSTGTLPSIAAFLHFSVQNKKAHDPTIQRTIMSFSMPPTGVEPVLCLQKGILSPSCLPISPQRRKNPAYKALLLPQNERAGNNRSEVKLWPHDRMTLYNKQKRCAAHHLSQFSKIVPIKTASLRYAVCGCCLCIKSYSFIMIQ